MDSAFYGCANLSTITATDAPDLTGVTSLSGMFLSCTNFNGSINHWNTANITNMSSLLEGAESFNKPLNSWNTANVTSMNSIFESCKLFNQNLSNWNTANVTDMQDVFIYADAFNGDITTWNTAKVTTMQGMFYGATSFNQDIGNWNTGNVTNMLSVFVGASTFNQNIGNWNTANVTNMSSMFLVATSFNQNISNWNTANVTNMSSMFGGATSFNQNIGSWNTTNVISMVGMFNGATSFNQNIGNWSTANVIGMANMFNGAISFNQNIGNWSTANVTNMSSMFNGATSFNQNIGYWSTVNVTNMASMFTGATSFNQNIGNWSTANVTNMSSMFYGASAFNQNLAKWQLKSSVNLTNMFSNSGMDCKRYSATLIGWAASASVPTSRSLGATGRTYGTNATSARNTLTTTKGWTITGDAAGSTACTLASDASLSNLTSTAGALSPAFVSNKYAYSLPATTSATTSPTVTATVTDANATIEWSLNGSSYTTIPSGVASASIPLAIGFNNIFIKVTAENGITTATYILSITRGVITWTGSTSTDWNTASNWDLGSVPATGDEVVIPSTATTFPIISTSQSLKSFTVASGKTVTLNANLEVSGTLSNSGTISGDYKVVLNGTAPQPIIGVGTISNLEINKTGTATISSGSSKVNITGTLTSTAGTLATNSNLVLKSTASGTGRIAPVLGTITGSISQERYVASKTARSYSLVASPFVQSIASSWQQQVHITGAGTGGSVCPSLTANSNGFDATVTNAANMFVYDGSKAVNTRWTSIASTSINLTPGTGYRMNIRGPRSTGCALLDGTTNTVSAVTLTSAGTLSNANKNLGSFTTTVANNGDASSANDNYLLVGNPYPSEISFSDLLAANSGTAGINNTYAMFAPGNTIGNYAFWDGSTWTGAKAGLSDATGNIIANGQAFFVQGKAAGADIILNWAENQKTSNANNGYFRTQANPNHLRISYLLANGNQADEIMVKFADKPSNHELNDGDVISINSGAQNLKSMKAGRELAFNTRSINFINDTVQLNVASSSNGNFKLSFYDFDEFVAGTNTKIYLLDKYTGSIQLMNDVKEYPFTVNTSDAASFGKGRFVVVFSKPAPMAIVPFHIGVKAYPNPVITELKVQLPQGSWTLRITDVTGKALVQQQASSRLQTINMAKLAPGTYFLETIDGHGEKSIQKIVKQ